MPNKVLQQTRISRAVEIVNAVDVTVGKPDFGGDMIVSAEGRLEYEITIRKVLDFLKPDPESVNIPAPHYENPAIRCPVWLASAGEAARS